ncbi:hypothetical protein L6R53_08990 [Myxococcota bacterium]|nr:hypothetical protein [Myxococcota bacterium]
MWPPPPAEAGADAYLSIDADGATLSVPARDFRVQAVLVLVLLPVAWAGIALLLALASPPRGAAWVGSGVFCALTGLSTPLGLLQLALAPRSARKTRTRLAPDGALVLAGGRRVAPGELTALRIGQPNALMKWQGILGRTATGEVTVLGRVPPSRRRELVAVGQWLAQALDLPLQVAPVELGMPAPTAAAFCYMPVQGIWLLASLAALLVAKEPRVRFAAKQSLAFYLLTGVALVALILPVVGLVALLPRDVGPAVGGALVLFIVLPLGLLRIAVGFVAAWRAYKDRPWVIPGMGWLSRRWLPGA